MARQSSARHFYEMLYNPLSKFSFKNTNLNLSRKSRTLVWTDRTELTILPNEMVRVADQTQSDPVTVFLLIFLRVLWNLLVPPTRHGRSTSLCNSVVDAATHRWHCCRQWLVTAVAIKHSNIATSMTTFREAQYLRFSTRMPCAYKEHWYSR